MLYDIFLYRELTHVLFLMFLCSIHLHVHCIMFACTHIFVYSMYLVS